MFKKTIFLTLFLITFFLTFSQTGKINGKIVDAKTGESLPGATVLIEGTTKGASSDFDGNFSLSGLQPGKYTIIASYITYDNKKFTGVEVKLNDVTDFNITLDQSSSQTLNEVVIQAEMNKENTNTLLVMQKNNASVSDGISSESIKKTPDRSTSDVIKRISGATIQDNKFAIIRGMSDRYNAAFINGAPLPSSESDKKAFSFDIFPANLLDNIVILKTATPDLPGDFAGGVIQINTKSLPEKNSQSISIGGGYNTQTTFKNYKTYEGGKTDWLGLDDGTRKLPASIPNSKDYSTVSNINKIEFAKDTKYSWALQNSKASPNFNLQYSLANVGKIFKKEAGSIFAITYNNNTNTSFTTRREFEEQGDYGAQKTREYVDTTFSNTILASALWNLSFKIHQNHQIGFKNLFSINSEDKVVTRKGAADINQPNWEKSNVRWFTQNQIYSGQLNGDHYIEKAKIKIKWVAGYSDIARDIPCLRKMNYTKSSLLENDSVPYAALIGADAVGTQNAGSMFFANTQENMKSFKYDISRQFKIKKTTHELKIGGYHQYRDRTFTARLFGYTQYRKPLVKFNNDLKLLDEDHIFAPENMGIIDGPGLYDGGFKLTEATTEKDSYKASSTLHAGYISLDSRFFNNRLRFIYGARIESYNQKLTTMISLLEKVTDTTVVDILPSINAVYGLTEKINIRLAYYQTVSRPEFRELAAFNFYDFVTDFSISGNPALIRAKIDNYDVRAEWFPGAGQIVSISGFYKRIQNAIEQAADVATQNRSLTFTNVALVTNIGAEIEYRFKLSRLLNLDSSRFLSNTTIFTNLAYIKSEVDVSKIIDSDPRPLQGQSPYIINAGVQYLDRGWGVSVSYNVIGRRIIIVGSKGEPNYWENPRHVLDLQLVKTLFKEKFEIKFNVRDILAQNQIFYQDINKNGKLDKGSEMANKPNIHDNKYDNIMVNTKLAPTLSLSFSYKF
ncbi:MAG: outer membrane beta-barrel protein [Burkholderiales bacterium]|nr:outer membrane beta-barrel protein [Bacteroidia bacterium]